MRLRGAVAGLAVISIVAPIAAGAKSDSDTGSVDTRTAVRKAKWADNVALSFGRRSVTWTSNGLPNHSRPSQYALPNTGVMVPSASTAHAAPDPTVAQDLDFAISTRPRKAANATSTGGGPIGVMISGAVLFNPYEGDGTTVALASNFTVKDSSGNDVAFVDTCNGHPTPMGAYHYHGLPACVTSQVDKSGGRSHLIGLAFDGFPIYGNRSIKGKVVKPGQLDRCNGITSRTPEFPKSVYHYVLPDTTTAKSSIGCFRGKVSSSLSRQIEAYGMFCPLVRAARARAARVG